MMGETDHAAVDRVETDQAEVRCDNCTRSSEVAFTLTANVDGGGTVETRFCSSGCLKEWTATTADSETVPRDRPHPRVRSSRARTY